MYMTFLLYSILVTSAPLGKYHRIARCCSHIVDVVRVVLSTARICMVCFRSCCACLCVLVGLPLTGCIRCSFSLLQHSFSRTRYFVLGYFCGYVTKRDRLDFVLQHGLCYPTGIQVHPRDHVAIRTQKSTRLPARCPYAIPLCDTIHILWTGHASDLEQLR